TSRPAAGIRRLRLRAPSPRGSRPSRPPAVGSDDPSDPTGEHRVQADLPKIVSVDDHVVEPPHVWSRWLPAKLAAQGPHVERRGIGTMRHVGGGTYEQTFDPDGPQADCWVYEDLVYINKRHVAAVGFDRDDMTMSPIT